ncbi:MULTISPECIES: (d)CMP kinase [unclassified Veillonella]|jgi:cytidylate kinase|uniref:(d)CMP kinase n=1 Tax=unclassified Veillonella TaxID=2630086 RepID=UPI00021A3C06|nr:MULTISPECIES: (d)CMP kinase [unclassified Veillonella]EGS33858.1 cytidylate kinase [Veillonella sp. oral taxon 780 str. F0422]MBS6627393.1 (d)CMP kinase [Veillonella sp. oral taxon 780]
MNRRISVAIDGPAGAGKSSISKVVAKKLGYLYIDTGAMYRGITWALLNAGISIDDVDAVEAALSKIQLELRVEETGLSVWVNGTDVSQDIRTQYVTSHVSQVAAQKAVRTKLVEMQRHMASAGGVILDGRDIGSVVLPNAELKVYLTASVETRGHRRWLELKDSENISLEEVCRTVAERDAMDMNRKESPLVCVDDAVVVETDHLSIEETVQTLVDLIRKAELGGHHG